MQKGALPALASTTVYRCMKRTGLLCLCKGGKRGDWRL